jgi:peptide/nickel transport system ATP-binding protein/oligopeptide transport system ATP-binding protein
MQPIVECLNLKKYFRTDSGTLRAVDSVSFQIQPGETVGLVGESGCGKSTIGRTILRLIEPTDGQVLFEGRDIFKMNRPDLQALRREMGIVFQNPHSALNPRMKVVQIVGEPLKTHGRANGQRMRSAVVRLLEQVGLKEEHLFRFPHQFSGGQCQRIAIARSLALDPRFLIFDEPTSALDVSVQAQVLNLIRRLQQKKQLTYLFITHDLQVVKHIADRILVMYLGQLMESGPVQAVFDRPFHPYSQALLAAIPSVDPMLRKDRILLEGDVPSPIDLPGGCRFHTRCRLSQPRCREAEPPWREVATNRLVACHMV